MDCVGLILNFDDFSSQLLLIARDSGSPPFDAPRYLIIQVLDTDDHDPEFPQFRVGNVLCTILLCLYIAMPLFY